MAKSDHVEGVARLSSTWSWKAGDLCLPAPQIAFWLDGRYKSLFSKEKLVMASIHSALFKLRQNLGNQRIQIPGDPEMRLSSPFKVNNYRFMIF